MVQNGGLFGSTAMGAGAAGAAWGTSTGIVTTGGAATTGWLTTTGGVTDGDGTPAAPVDWSWMKRVSGVREQSRHWIGAR